VKVVAVVVVVLRWFGDSAGITLPQAVAVHGGEGGAMT
jgi:hypothetical protein